MNKKEIKFQELKKNTFFRNKLEYMAKKADEYFAEEEEEKKIKKIITLDEVFNINVIKKNNIVY
jgi:hypothetical protein